MINHGLPNDHRGFGRTACALAELLAGTAGVDAERATAATQWLLPLPQALGAPETCAGLDFAAHYDTEIRALAAAALRSPAALDLVTRWNAVTTPNEAPLRYLIRWTTAPAT